jgi:oligopeptide/dipeptide ABC transporter ATP-binding protein
VSVEVTERTEPAQQTAREPLVKLEGVKKHFPLTRGIIFQKRIGQVHAVDGVDLEIYPGETLGLVGETGCGKSTLARVVMRLQESTAGKIIFNGRDITHTKGRELRTVRRDMQMIFQDPYASLNPRKTVGTIIGEPFRLHRSIPRKKIRNEVKELMQLVGLNPEHYNRYPHAFSGGQRQRIGFARALALRPKLIVADEPVSALDVSIQAQILNLLSQLQHELGLTIVFIAHDLSVVRHMCDRVAVMYLGTIVELADNETLYTHPRHPYTGALLSAVPVADPHDARSKKRQILGGDVPSPINPPSGCRFHPRCPRAQFPKCKEDEPALLPHHPGQVAACHFPLEDRAILDIVGAGEE